MGDEYDVVIAGAGPAGGQCARYITENSNYSVLLLDRTNEIGQPKKSTAGTFAHTVDKFDLPKKVIQSKINNLCFEGSKEEIDVPMEGYVLEFRNGYLGLWLCS